MDLQEIKLLYRIFYLNKNIFIDLNILDIKYIYFNYIDFTLFCLNNFFFEALYKIVILLSLKF